MTDHEQTDTSTHTNSMGCIQYSRETLDIDMEHEPTNSIVQYMLPFCHVATVMTSSVFDDNAGGGVAHLWTREVFRHREASDNCCVLVLKPLESR